MREIELHGKHGKGKVAVIDDGDYHLVTPHRWFCQARRNGKSTYAWTEINGRQIMMHRLINATPASFQTDHINGNGLDNRRINLRSATQMQNSANRRRHSNSTSGYKGVYWNKKISRWRARIKRTGTNSYHSLGHYKTAEEAARAYDQAARRLHGEFARTNF